MVQLLWKTGWWFLKKIKYTALPTPLMSPVATLYHPTMVNPTVFNIHWQCESLGHASFELYADKVPKTAENSSILSTEEKGFGYQGPCCPSIIPGFTYLGGDFISCRGTGSKSTTRRNFSKSGITRSCGNSICCCLVFVSLS